jgi:hypothetical protein
LDGAENETFSVSSCCFHSSSCWGAKNEFLPLRLRQWRGKSAVFIFHRRSSRLRPKGLPNRDAVSQAG